MKMTIEEFKEETMCGNPGYCKECKDITHYSAEPDACNYHCDECGNESVFGLEMAMVMELIEITN
jgi:hypothetical protein